jgi:NADH:ubiquinone oxidoreductase subunit 6 (subunit J)
MIVTFYIAGTLAIAAALGTVLARDPLRAALSLVLCLLSLAVLYVTLSAHFVAAIQIIVYAGQVMVFFVHRANCSQANSKAFSFPVFTVQSPRVHNCLLFSIKSPPLVFLSAR